MPNNIISMQYPVSANVHTVPILNAEVTYLGLGGTEYEGPLVMNK